MSQPTVSIIIPAYNAAHWLGETLDGAFGQSWQPIEVILVDDGSTDGTSAIARSYESRGLRIVSQARRGLSGARNSGLRVARGDYIQFLDADDLLAPDKVEHQVRMLMQAPAGTLATGRWGRFRRDPARTLFRHSPYWRDLDPETYLAGVASTGNSVPVHAWLLPRGLVERIGPFVEEIRTMEDHEYFARAVLACSGIRFCNEARCFYRSFHAFTLSKGRDDTTFESMFRTVELVAAHLLVDASPKRKQIAADYYQWLVFALYPNRPDLLRLAGERVKALGGSRIKPLMGRRAQALSRLVGWKLALRLRAWLWSMGIYLGKNDVVRD